MEDEVINRGYLERLEAGELMFLPFFLFLVFMVTYAYQRKMKNNNPSYTYLARGVMAKLVGGTVFCFVYIYYYKGGDTISYFESARSYANLLELRPASFVGVYFGENSAENYSMFDMYTGFPYYLMFFENRAAFVVKLITPFVIVGGKSYLISTLLLSLTSFVGIWRAYQMFYRYYPKFYRPLALGFIFLPSCIFWGSGILKDTITLSGFCWFVSSFEKCFISKDKRLINLLIWLFAGYIVLVIKPYIIMAAVPGIIAWLFHRRVVRIKSPFFRMMAIPMIFILSLLLGIGLLTILGNRLDKFSIDKVLFSAKEAQMDLKNEAYAGHAFDIGDYDASIAGIFAKIPIGTISGLFRPFIWEAKNFVMILSALENLGLIYLFIYPLVKFGPRKVFTILFNHPLLLFIFSYSVLFAFSIGISTSNFGALIRFKIAFAPFLAAMLLILYNYRKLDLLKPVVR